jgi:LacI family transcriptional regulator
MRSPTAQDVADLAGVSRSAVSLVLNGRAEGNIAPNKQKAILEAAERLNYRPNAVALSLRNQRTRTIGVLTWPNVAGPPGLILRAALQAATDAGYLLILMDTGGDQEIESQALATLRDRQVEALLVVAPDLTDYQPPEPMMSLPTILVNCADPQARVTSVVPDEAGAGAAAARILIDAGHSKIGLLAGPPDAVQTRLRVAGCHQVVAAADLDGRAQFISSCDIASAEAAARKLLEQPEPPTALICTHERLAVGAVLAAAKLQLNIPKQLSLVSLEDGEQLACQCAPQLTTIERPDRPMAGQAVSMLVERLANDAEDSVKQLLFVCPPVHRDSVAAPLAGRQSAAARASR